MRIGIDIDGVLFPWTEVVNEAVVAKFGIPDPGEHQHWEHLREAITPEQWAWLWTGEGQAIVFGQTRRVYVDAVAPFNYLIRDPGRKCHFVTHRDPRRTGGHTFEFLAHFFGGHPWAGLHVLQNGTPKHELAAWDVFVDDKPETVRNMLWHTEAVVFCPARPWNTDVAAWRHPRLVRYDDPWEIVDWVEAQ